MNLDTSDVVDSEIENIIPKIKACLISDHSRICDVFNVSSAVGNTTEPEEIIGVPCADLLHSTFYLPNVQCPVNVFVSGKYTGKTHSDVARNVALAQQYAQAIMMRGNNVFCPHTMTAHWEESAPDIMYGEYIEMCKVYIDEWADAIFMLPGNEDSMGARVELEFAMDCGITVYENITEVPFYWKRIVKRYEE